MPELQHISTRVSGTFARRNKAGAMVLLHVKTSKDLEFMVEAQTVERVADVLQRLVNLHNRSVCISSWKEVWSACRASIDQSTGLPEACLQLVDRAFEAALDLVGTKAADKKLPLTEGALSDAFEAIRRSLPKELAGIVPQEHALLSLLPGSQPAPETAALSPQLKVVIFLPLIESQGALVGRNAHGRVAGMGGRLPLLTMDSAVLWFNHKQMLPDRKLSDYVGKNEKTKANVQLQHSDHGRPLRAVNKDAEKAMLAYYFRKQEEQKVMRRSSKLLQNGHLLKAPHGLIPML